MKNILRLFCVAFFVIIVGFFSTDELVKADQGTAWQEQKDGLQTAPPNLGLDDNMFERGDFSNYKNSNGGTVTNMAQLSDENVHSSGDMRAIRMTYYKNQAGAIWSKIGSTPGEGNYIDIKKKQTLSMWLYFGPKTHTDVNDGSNFGDGMAFVLQNNADGVSEFAHKGTQIGVGETLGVWGVDSDPKQNDPQVIADSAIPHSWALEFDTHSNNSSDPGASDSFDNGINADQHMAYGYPSDKNTYSVAGRSPTYFLGNLISGGYYFTQNHTGVLPVTLHDGQWHHLTIEWNPTLFIATFSFNDKNTDGTKGKTPLTVTTDPIRPQIFGKVPNNELQWGFTATTGSYYQPNLIAFESIPSSVEGDASASITDSTQGGSDVSSTSSVNSNDQLSINYKLNYVSGHDPWKNITSDIDLPKNITYIPDSDGNVGTVTYEDGSSIKIPMSALSGTTIKGYKIPRGLLKTGDSATISIIGVANAVNANTNVDSAHTQFDSDTLIKDVDTPSFTIKKAKPINLKLDQSNISVDPNADANITGKVFYTDGTTITNSQMSVYQTLNGEKLSGVVMSGDVSGQLKLTIPADKLKLDTNTLEVYVADPNGNRSSVSKVIITKKGSLSLTVNKAYEFGSINDSAVSRLIARKGNWDILVNDGREVSPANTWKLSADTTDLTNSSGKFNGNMIYRDSNGIESVLTGDNLVNIANGVKTQTGQQTTNIASDWDDSDGIFLRSNGLTTAGNYDGEIHWTLSDAV